MRGEEGKRERGREGEGERGKGGKGERGRGERGRGGEGEGERGRGGEGERGRGGDMDIEKRGTLLVQLARAPMTKESLMPTNINLYIASTYYFQLVSSLSPSLLSLSYLSFTLSVPYVSHMNIEVLGLVIQ